MKIGCITVSTSPVKAVIDDLIQKLFDALVISLRRSIMNDFAKVDTYLTKGMETLGSVPQTIDEISHANQQYSLLSKDKVEVSSCSIGVFQQVIHYKTIVI